MPELASSTFEDDLIADLRAHGGTVSQGPLAGQELLIVTTEGAKSGESHRAILTISRDGEDYRDQHVAALPHFAGYPEQTGRVIPMVRLARVP